LYFCLPALGALGIVVAAYFGRILGSRSPVAMRLLIFIGAAMIVEFTEMYAYAVANAGLGLSATLAPNVAFLVSMAMYAFLRFQIRPVPANSLTDDSRLPVDRP
jgi:hypothetical protein